MRIANSLRPSMLGDIIASLPFLHYLEKCYPNSYKMVYIDKKCSHIAPFLLNHPLIDKLYISDQIDKVSEKDEEYFKKFDLVFEPFVPVYFHDWFNHIHITESLFRLNFLRGAGYINPEEWNKLTEEEKHPKLEKWFELPTLVGPEKKIAIWPFSGYGNNDPTINQRSPSLDWWVKLVTLLKSEGYEIWQYGHPLSHRLPGTCPRLDLSLFDAIKESLACDLSITTDSGSSWLLNAYGHRNICLFTNYQEGHTTNVDAYVPKNWKNNLISLWGKDNINNISQLDILDAIKIF